MLTVALLGSSLSVAGVGASLAARPGLRVVQLDAVTVLDDTLLLVEPDVLVFDLSGGHLDVVALWQRHPGVLPVGVDLLGHRAVVFTRESTAVSTTDDLLHVIGDRTGPHLQERRAEARRGSSDRPRGAGALRPPGDGEKGETE